MEFIDGNIWKSWSFCGIYSIYRNCYPYIQTLNLNKLENFIDLDHLLIGGLEPFPYIGNVIIPTDELIFFRGAAQPPSRKSWSLRRET